MKKMYIPGSSKGCCLEVFEYFPRLKASFSNPLVDVDKGSKRVLRRYVRNTSESKQFTAETQKLREEPYCVVQNHVITRLQSHFRGPRLQGGFGP